MFSRIMKCTIRNRLCLLVTINIYIFTSVAGCSIIDRDHNFNALTNEKVWSMVMDANQYNKEQIQFKNNNIIVTTSSTFHAGSCPISIGPPLAPVIPAFFLCFNNNYNFSLALDVKTNRDVNSINMQGLKIISSEGRAIPIERGSYCVFDEEPSPSTYWSSCRGRKTIPSTPFVLGKGRFLFLLTYKGIGDPDQITLEFTEVYSGVDVPPISFQGNNSYIFCPFVFSGHERCFHF